MCICMSIFVFRYRCYVLNENSTFDMFECQKIEKNTDRYWYGNIFTHKFAIMWLDGSVFHPSQLCITGIYQCCTIISAVSIWNVAPKENKGESGNVQQEPYSLLVIRLALNLSFVINLKSYHRLIRILNDTKVIPLLYY